MPTEVSWQVTAGPTAQQRHHQAPRGTPQVPWVQVRHRAPPQAQGLTGSPVGRSQAQNQDPAPAVPRLPCTFNSGKPYFSLTVF